VGAQGGRQRIPRPATARVGAAAPWASLASRPAPITVERVRARLLGYTAPPAPTVVPGARAAAVLLPVFEEDGEARLVLTRRPDTMPSHRGDVAFPGGKVEHGIDRDARDAALREAEEEIGLRRETVDVVATLTPVNSVASNFDIVPFVGITDGRPDVHAESWEVDRVFDVALAELLAEGVYHEERWPGFDGIERAMHFFEVDDETIWGATARILTVFLARVVGVPG
jgi:8-oxo-dGTP pyrophosphatase MutT (NUDIX family)